MHTVNFLDTPLKGGGMTGFIGAMARLWYSSDPILWNLGPIALGLAPRAAGSGPVSQARAWALFPMAPGLGPHALVPRPRVPSPGLMGPGPLSPGHSTLDPRPWAPGPPWSYSGLRSLLHQSRPRECIN